MAGRHRGLGARPREPAPSPCTPPKTCDYDKLLLATGSAVRTLTAPGSELPGVHYLRTLDQSDELLAGFQSGAPGGGGRRRVDRAGDCSRRPPARCAVTVVEMDSLPLRRVLGDEVATVYRDLHAAHGVDFRFGAGVREIVAATERVETCPWWCWTMAGRSPPTLVVVGVGIRPNVELAAAAGLEVDNGVVTDAHLRTSDPNVYACGDVASSFNPLLGQPSSGRTLGECAERWTGRRPVDAGGRARAEYAPVPYFFSDQYDLGMEYTGWVAPGEYDQVVFRGDPTRRRRCGTGVPGVLGAGRGRAGRDERQCLGRHRDHRRVWSRPG